MRVELVSADRVRIQARHLPGDAALAIVLAHGFTGSIRQPPVRRISQWLNHTAGVVLFDFRGHGRSGGRSTVGDKEIHDVEAAVRYARELGYAKVATIGFSMGASIVLRHAAMLSGVDAVVAVSGPARWFYRETGPMRRVHWVIERPLGRVVARIWLRTRISSVPWDPLPLSPSDAAALVAPTPLLVVHGDRDGYFPVDHAEQVYAAAGDPKELWIEAGFGHAESAATADLVGRIGTWVASSVSGRPRPQP